jgi:hypothetical protein
MDGRAISAGALGAAGLGTLTGDFGRTRLAEILRPPGEGRSADIDGQMPARARAADMARATRP